MKPSTTYEDYSIISDLSGMNCFGSIGLNDTTQTEFIFAFNASSTKAVVIRQPNPSSSKITINDLQDLGMKLLTDEEVDQFTE